MYVSAAPSRHHRRGRNPWSLCVFGACRAFSYFLSYFMVSFSFCRTHWLGFLICVLIVAALPRLLIRLLLCLLTLLPRFHFYPIRKSLSFLPRCLARTVITRLLRGPMIAVALMRTARKTFATLVLHVRSVRTYG